jgi:hypothetical protein
MIRPVAEEFCNGHFASFDSSFQVRAIDPCVGRSSGFLSSAGVSGLMKSIADATLL